MQVMKTNSEDPEVISLAIDVVAVAGDDRLASQLIEFLLGEADGIPKVSTVRAAGTSLAPLPQQTEKYFSPYLTGKTSRLHYKAQPVNARAHTITYWSGDTEPYINPLKTEFPLNNIQ
jgi:hypothetical protein